jgi:Na+/H+ antiporter NhaD/arsenite permease-like protein
MMAAAVIQPNPWMIVPFAMLLGIIALAPLCVPKFWHQHYPKVALALGAVTLVYYLVGLRAYGRVGHVAHEYASFIALVGALFVVAGGIHINVKGEATPLVNVGFLLLGALLANFLGTTGASMLLIRPWLRMNRYRVTTHHVVFFIFIIANVGGCLTPIGDPPLFLGYLKGVPFWWVAEHAWLPWCAGLGALLAIFYVVDRRNYLRVPKAVRADHAEPEQWRFEGLHNFLFIGLIIAAVFIDQPVFLREGLMLAAALGSWFTTKARIHEANQFDFEPIREVTTLFAGIFATMIPALDWLELNARTLFAPSPTSFYWGTGVLSSFLDNAPTYLSFLSAQIGSAVFPEQVTQLVADVQAHGANYASLAATNGAPFPQVVAVLQKYHAADLANGTLLAHHAQVSFLLADPRQNHILLAISMAAVFFGACTYIGNGPNFMVKSIADQQKVHTPDFLGYLFKFTVPFLLPVLGLLWLIFFRT